MFACLFVPDFPVQAALLPEEQARRADLRRSPIVIWDGPANLLQVVARNNPARKAGIEIGMTKLQVEIFGGVIARKRCAAEEEFAQHKLIGCANAFSPRVESTCPGTVILDLSGTEKLLGNLESVAGKIERLAEESGFQLQIAIASNPDAALYAARGFRGITIIPSGQEAMKLARLRVNVLPVKPEMRETLESWGIRIFRALAELPEIPLTERLGQEGLFLQRLARGEIRRELALTDEIPRFVESYEFDDPVETLDSVSFVLNRLLQNVCARLMSRSLATNELRLRLNLEVRQREKGMIGEKYQQAWKLPVPTQDKKVLFSLVQLDLEKQAFIAPIKKATIEAMPMKPRMAQGNLFAPPSPEAERLEITLARIRGIVGACDGDGLSCVGSPRLLDTHKPDSFTIESFSSVATTSSATATASTVALRVFRPALETSVQVTGTVPNLVRFARKYRRVLAASGPWCCSGNWWNNAWSREEWDVALKTTAGIGLYRIFRDRIREQWFVEGIFD
jgi:protein ImuB